MITIRGRKPAVAVVAMFGIIVIGAGCGSGDDNEPTAAQQPPAEDVAAVEESAMTDDDAAPTNPCGPNPAAEGIGREGGPPAEGATIVEVAAVDHAFQGVDDAYPAGSYGFVFSNHGEELHELALMRVVDGEGRSAEELVGLPEEEQRELAEYVGGVAACPGDRTEVLGAELTPGRYLLLDFVPMGMRADLPDDAVADVLDNPPHFIDGMFADFRVSA